MAHASAILLIHTFTDLRSYHGSNYRTKHSSNGSGVALANARPYDTTHCTAEDDANCLAVAGAVQNAVVPWPACAFVSRVVRVVFLSPSVCRCPWRWVTPSGACYSHRKHASPKTDLRPCGASDGVTPASHCYPYILVRNPQVNGT